MDPADFGAPPASACTQGSGGADRITRTIYDTAGQRVQLRAGVGTSIEAAEATWAYNLSGQVTTVIDGNGNRAALHYDGHGRQDRWTFPSITRAAAYNDATQASALASAGAVNAADYEEYAYDPNGNRTSLRKRDNTTLAYSYDALNRMILKVVPERPAPHPYPLTAAQTRDVYYSYDLRNLQLSARFDSQSGEGIASTYDGFGRLASSSTNMGGVTRTLGYVYNRNGARIRITHPDGISFDTGHDGLGRPISLADQVSVRHLIGYTPHGGPVAVIRNNRTMVIYSYDGLQRLGYIAMGHDFPGYTEDVFITLARNPAGQISSIARNNDAYAWGGHYAVARAYTTDGLNRYTAAGTAAFGYDANGNLTSDGTNTLTYDVENRLVGRSGNVSLSYDPLGRLFSVAGGGTTTQFLYDGDALVAEYDGAGAMTRRYVHNEGADVPLLSYAGSSVSQPSYLHADHQGSIVAVSDAAGTSAINTYDEYGIPGSANSGRFQYTGQIWLDEIGMYHYKARVYSPTLGRFLQTDPIGYDDQFNLYAYVGNDPANRADPTGTSCTLTTGSHGRQSASCQIDRIMGDDGKMRDATASDHRRYSRYERAYTRAVNRLLANRDRTQTITTRAPTRGPGSDLSASSRTFTTSAGALADELIAVQISALPNVDAATLTSVPGQPRMEGEPTDRTIMYVGRRGLAGGPVQGVPDLGAEKNIGLQLAHDAMHPRADNGLAFNPARDPWQRLHQEPFNEAARWFLGY